MTKVWIQTESYVTYKWHYFRDRKSPMNGVRSVTRLVKCTQESELGAVVEDSIHDKSGSIYPFCLSPSKPVPTFSITDHLGPKLGLLTSQVLGLKSLYDGEERTSHDSEGGRFSK